MIVPKIVRKINPYIDWVVTFLQLYAFLLLLTPFQIGISDDDLPIHAICSMKATFSCLMFISNNRCSLLLKQGKILLLGMKTIIFFDWRTFSVLSFSCTVFIHINMPMLLGAWYLNVCLSFFPFSFFPFPYVAWYITIYLLSLPSFT